MLLYIVFAAAIIAADILTKYLATSYLMEKDITLIENILYFSYVENRGAAFGILQNARWLFIVISVAVIAAIIIYLAVKKPESKLFIMGLAAVSGGGIGNLIDRVSSGYVVDFIDFRIINFPVFNVADIFVCVEAALIFIYVLFIEGKENGKKA